MKVLVIGFFGYLNEQLDGQTVKTRNVLELYKTQYHDVDYFDTQILQNSKIQIIVLFWKLFYCDEIIYLPGFNNLKKFSSIILFISKLKKVKVKYFVVGGWLVDFLKERPKNVCNIKKFDIIYVETMYLLNGLKEMGVSNVKLFPNFRITSFKPTIDKCINNDAFKVVFMARVMPEKGVETLLEVSRILEQKFTLKDIVIDIYGQINTSYKEVFNEGLRSCKLVSYKGVLQPNDIYKTLTNYDALVLPTYYEGEGFPGTIVDSYISGLPVITTNWKQIPEFVVHGTTGFLVEPQNADAIVDVILELINNRELLYEMKLNAYEKSKDYTFEKALSLI